MNASWPSLIGQTIAVRELDVLAAGDGVAFELNVLDQLRGAWGVGLWVRNTSGNIGVAFQSASSATIEATAPIRVQGNHASEMLAFARGRIAQGPILWIGSSVDTTVHITVVALWPIELQSQSAV